jgi:hypothetical protein
MYDRSLIAIISSSQDLKLELRYAMVLTVNNELFQSICVSSCDLDNLIPHSVDLMIFKILNLYLLHISTKKDKGTDPPVPTYDPTKAGTLPPTPRPTFGNSSWTPPPNPYIDKFNTTEWQTFNAAQWEQRYQNSLQIKEKYGSYCPNDPLVPMCPVLNADKDIANKAWNVLLQGPTTPCIQTGDKTQRCGVDNPWLNKTIWPLIRGPFCVGLNNARKNQYSTPAELVPYHELGYDRADPTQSTDAAPFDGGAATGNLWFDANKVKDHFLKFEAMLEHYYEGLSRPLLEEAFQPTPESPLYAPMLQAYADQISRALLRRKENGEADNAIVIGVLGDSVTSGTDNCYYDAWPEQFRRQMAPLFGSMGLKLDIRNAAKNGGWMLAPQMLCANDSELIGIRCFELHVVGNSYS